MGGMSTCCVLTSRTPRTERAKTDPAGFAAMLSPATLQRLRDLSVKLSDQKR